jgi:hypothetical protein
MTAATVLVVGGCTSGTSGAGAGATSDTGQPAPTPASASGSASESGSSQASPQSPGTSPTAGNKSPRPTTELTAAADEVLALLVEKDYQGLADRVHPTQGVRFTPYLTVDVEGDVKLSPEEVSGLGSSTKKYIWGAEPGSGKIIRTTFAKYAERFITNLDYANAPVITQDESSSSGSSLDNVSEAYPKSHYVEYHFPGSDKYAGMDWQSQRLVFTSESGKLYLVGVVHDSWTP